MLSGETSGSRSWGNLLIFALFLQVSAWAYEGYFNSTPLNSILFLNFDLADSTASLIDNISAIVSLSSFFLFLFTKKANILLVPLAYAIALPICTMVLHSSFACELALLTHGARIGLPLVLFLYYRGEQNWTIDKRFLIRFTVGLTFVGHGIECLMEHPKFTDFLIEGFGMGFGMELTEETAIQILILIGAVDIVLGITGLIKPRVWIYSWMAFWGLLTAAARVMYFQWDGIFPMLLRSAHWALPTIAVLMILEKKK